MGVRRVWLGVAGEKKGPRIEKKQGGYIFMYVRDERVEDNFAEEFSVLAPPRCGLEELGLTEARQGAVHHSLEGTFLCHRSDGCRLSDRRSITWGSGSRIGVVRHF